MGARGADDAAHDAVRSRDLGFVAVVVPERVACGGLVGDGLFTSALLLLLVRVVLVDHHRMVWGGEEEEVDAATL